MFAATGANVITAAIVAGLLSRGEMDGLSLPTNCAASKAEDPSISSDGVQMQLVMENQRKKCCPLLSQAVDFEAGAWLRWNWYPRADISGNAA